MATKTKNVELPQIWWDRVDMALDIAKIRSIHHGSSVAADQYAEVQMEIERQLKLEDEAHARHEGSSDRYGLDEVGDRLGP